jgi:nucleotide-binding universal stress UspA family protein
MNKIKKILAPTDLSELSRAGVRYALETAAATGSEVIVYNVVGFHEALPYYEFENAYLADQLPTVEEVLEDHRKYLAKFLQENFADLTAGVKVRLEVAVGTPYQKMVEKAAQENVGLIVMSTHGRTGLFHTLIGSVAEKVVRLAACPVLTVRPEIDAAKTRAAA